MLKRSLFIATSLLLCAPFDADAFMSGATGEGGTLDTNVPVVPAGDYRAMFGEFTSENGFRTFTGTNEAKASFGKEFTMFQPPFVLQDDPRLAEVKAFFGAEKPTIVRHQGIFIDVSDSGGLDMSKGKNVDLGKLLEAVGQNPMPAGWGFSNLIGAGPVVVKVVHETDRNDDTKKYARVSKVAKISS